MNACLRVLAWIAASAGLMSCGETALTSVQQSDAAQAESCTQDDDCEDEYLCNGRELCISGRCVAGLAPFCDDGDPCTLDGCTEGRGCVHVPASAACESRGAAGTTPAMVDAGLLGLAGDAGGDSGASPGPAPRVPPTDPARPPNVDCPTSVPRIEADTSDELSLFEGVVCVAGSVVLAAELGDLSPLSNLRRVDGSFSYAGPSAALSALSGLRRAGAIAVDAPEQEEQDSDTVDFPALEWVGDSLAIERPLPQDALASLRYVGRAIDLAPPPEGSVAPRRLQALQVLGGDLSLGDGLPLGLPSLTRVGGNLSSTEATQVQLDSLTKLREIGGDLAAVGMDPVSRIALPALQRVSGTLLVRGNLALDALELPALQRVGLLDIRLNPALSRCQVDAVHDRLAGTFEQPPLLCCNGGCTHCDGGSCAEAGGIEAGQSTFLRGSVMASTIHPASLASVETAQELTLAFTAPFASEFGELPLREAETLIISGSELSNLSGLSQLRRVDALGIDSNRSLSSLHGLSGLQRLGGLSIVRNRALVDVSAIDPSRGGSLQEATGAVSIYDNSTLSHCEVDLLLQSLEALGAMRGRESGNRSCAGTCNGPVCE